jgi:hypothetical protein
MRKGKQRPWSLSFAAHLKMRNKDEKQAGGSGPNDTGANGPRFSAAPNGARIILTLSPSPSGLGSRLAAGPPGLAFMEILRCPFFLKLP